MKTPIKTKKNAARISAVIDIGSSAIRLLIAEYTNDKWRRLDSMEKRTTLGHDVFDDGEINRKSMLDCLKILSLFKEVLTSWKINSNDVQAIGTSALREASNRDVFIDRVFLRTGFKVRVIEGVEANQLTYTAVQDAMSSSWSKFNQANSLVVEVSGGSTEIMLLHRGSIVSSHSLHMGTIRIAQQLKDFHSSNELLTTVIHDNITNTADIFEGEFSLKKTRHFVALGSEMRFLASKIGVLHKSLWKISKEDFCSFIQQLHSQSPNQISSSQFNTLNNAATLLPALAVYESLLNRTAARFILVPDVSIRDGLLIALGGKGKVARQKLKTQVLASALNLGRKYHFDEAHARQVSALSLQLFDSLKKAHALGEKHKMLLEVAATLHDMGTFINQSAHHKHSAYIINNSEIFGLNTDDIDIVSHTVRYHRKSLPNDAHLEFKALSTKARVIVMKLAAILRVADSLDAGHAGRTHICKIQYDENIFKIFTDDTLDKSLERISLSRKQDLFEEVYGMEIKLINRSHMT